MIPLYNGQDYVKVLIDSLKAQTYGNFEVIFADDFSTDHSVSVVKKIIEEDERFKLVIVDQKKGSAAKVNNFILPYCNGDFLFYFSQDDFASTDLFESMINKIVENSDVDAVVPYVSMFYSDIPKNEHKLIGFQIDRGNVMSGRNACQLSLNWSIPGNALLRRSVVLNTGCWDEWSANADEYSARKFYLNSRHVAFSEGVFYYRQDNPNAVTKKMSVNLFDWPYTELKLFELLRFNDFNDEVLLMVLKRAITFYEHYRNLLLKLSDSDNIDASLAQQKLERFLKLANRLAVVDVG